MASLTPSKGQRLEWSDLVSELREMTEETLQAKKTGQKLGREDIFDEQLHKKRLSLIEELRQTPSGLCPVLAKSIRYGVGYHHSGLSNDEKLIIEKGYREGTLLCLTATSTLSTGINLPAKVVVFKQPLIANALVDPAKYKQMAGRAGRTGFDTSGDVVVITSTAEQMKHTRNVLLIPFQAKLTSAMFGSRLIRSILEVIASIAVCSLSELA